MRNPIQVAIGVVVERRGDAVWILIARRRRDSVLGGFWEFPGGKIEPNETPGACVVRELAEELGVEVQVIGELNVIEHAYEHATVRLHPLLCRRVSGEAQPIMVDECRWVAAARLGDYTFPPANAPLLAQLRQRVQTGTLGAS